MKKKDFINYILKNIIGDEPTGYYAIYCDRSQSLNDTARRQMFFLRLKYPCFSQKVKINFYEYKERIQSYLKSIGENYATVHLKQTCSNGYGKYYFIEIIFHKGKPWKKNADEIVTKQKSNTNTTYSNTASIKPQDKIEQDTVNISKCKLANLIRIALKNNSTLAFGDLLNASDDLLIELFKQTSK